MVTSGCEAPGWCQDAHVVGAVLRCEAQGGVRTLTWWGLSSGVKLVASGCSAGRSCLALG